MVGGEQDGAESPSRSGTPTGWATFAGSPQTTQKRGVGNETRLGLSLFGESRMFQFRDKDPLKAMRMIKEVPLETRVPRSHPLMSCLGSSQLSRLVLRKAASVWCPDLREQKLWQLSSSLCSSSFCSGPLSTPSSGPLFPHLRNGPRVGLESWKSPRSSDNARSSVHTVPYGSPPPHLNSTPTEQLLPLAGR